MPENMLKNMTVGEVAVQHPELKPLLEKMGIDYCCGGARPLGDAVRQAGLDPDDVFRNLESAIQAARQEGRDFTNWSQASLTDLVRHILDTHHVFMRDVLPRIADLLKKVIAAHGERHGDMLRAVQGDFLALRQEIEMHLMKEEQVLFPYIEQLDAFRPGQDKLPVSHCGTVRNPIRQMVYEHDNAGDALQRMRKETGDYTLPEDACASFASLYEAIQAMENDLHEHIHLENNVLFPKAIELERQIMGA